MAFSCSEGCLPSFTFLASLFFLSLKPPLTELFVIHLGLWDQGWLEADSL